jgi:hypothetical protein
LTQAYAPLFPRDTTEVVLEERSGFTRSTRLVKVLKVTATLVVLPPAFSHQKDRRFDIFTGYERGVGRSIGTTVPCIYPPTPAARERARASAACDELHSLAFKVGQCLQSEEFRKRNRSADELELSLASLRAAYELLTA